MDSIRDILAANLDAVERRVAAACARAGRARQQVTLVAVTKSVSAEIAARLAELGTLDLGENRPQELWSKAAALPATVRWHLIGHLQRNKIDRTLPLVHRIHSIDSVRLIEAIEAHGRPGGGVGRVSLPTGDPGEAAAARDTSPTPVEGFLEFNCSGEASKDGFAPHEVDDLIPVLRRLRHLRIVGLMTMAAYQDDPERCRPTFAALRGLVTQMRDRAGDVHPLNELSMGMSNDFEVAIEEGATSLRLGTVLFTGLPGRADG